MPIPVTKEDQPGRKPEWLRVRAPGGEDYAELKKRLHGLNLHTVCEEASCPNLGECWGSGTATVMILGDVCTRSCRFCDVASGDPGGILDQHEPARVAEVLAGLDLRYVVITSVDRDDLPDGGASHFADTVREVKERSPGLIVEVLIPDFGGERDSIETVLGAGPEVVSHNLETVRRLSREVRDARASYELSLKVLAGLKGLAAGVRTERVWTKSGLMLGMGESEDEVVEAMGDLRAAGVDFLTLGQYLSPGSRHYPVKEYIPPERFEEFRVAGEEMGFMYVASGPLVRSSYRAAEFFITNVIDSAAADTSKTEAE